MTRSHTILIVEDTPALASTYSAYLTTAGAGYDCTIAGTARDALRTLERSPDVRVAVVDVNLPDASGLAVLKEIRARHPGCETIIITASGSVSLAVDAMRHGAFDFIVKPFTADRLRVTVRNALERHRLWKAVETLKADFGRDSFQGFIGRSAAMQSLYRIIRNAAASKATIFVTGESGTGKEVCAEAIHRISSRHDKPFVAINCAAIPRDLLESEIFGHVKGAFTGASSDRLGAALQADGGTLFLDEIGELELSFQAKLLRFLQTGTVQRVGEDRPRPCDVRIVCATNRNPQEQVAAGKFREDLFYRLYVIPIDLPPLSEREDDVLLIANYFLQKFSAEDGKGFKSFSARAEEALLGHHWPGNVRELQNVVRNVVVLNDGDEVEASMLPSTLTRDNAAGRRPAPPPARQAPGEPGIVPLDLLVERAIDDAMAMCGGSIPKAALALQVSPSTIYRRLQSRADRLAG